MYFLSWPFSLISSACEIGRSTCGAACVVSSFQSPIKNCINALMCAVSRLQCAVGFFPQCLHIGTNPAVHAATGRDCGKHLANEFRREFHYLLSGRKMANSEQTPVTTAATASTVVFGTPTTVATVTREAIPAWVEGSLMRLMMLKMVAPMVRKECCRCRL